MRSTLTDEQGRIVSIGKADPGNSAKGVFAGAYVLEPEVYRLLPERKCSVIAEGFRPAMRTGLMVQGCRHHFVWHDLGTWCGLARAVFAVLGSTSLSALADGPYGEVAQLSPGRFVFHRGEAGIAPPAYIGPGVSIPKQSVAGPLAAVGAGSLLQPGATVSDSVLLPGCVVDGQIAGSVLWEGWSAPHT